MDIPILFEDDNLLVVDKPSGIVVNRSESVKKDTLQDWAEREYQISIRSTSSGQEIKDKKLNNSQRDFYDRSGIVHRLDKETSGLLIIAKTSQAFFYLQSQFGKREVVKKYYALVHGKLEVQEGSIKANVGRLPWNRKKFGVLPSGREAITSYKLLKLLRSPKRETLSFLEVLPHTGRTHQIRVHLKYINHPVVSDPDYAGRKVYREDLKFCSRLFLHAGYLKFKHPITEKVIKIESLLPKELEEVLKDCINN